MFYIAYLIIVNILAFLQMGLDKRAAIRGEGRIPEAALILMAFGGGTIGEITGMYIFRHKTLKPKFKYGLPAILLLQIGLTIWVLTL